MDLSPSAPKCPHAGLRRGFTLVELLITITIIGILAGISLGALGAARETARASKTKSTIVKLDRIVMAKYESYRTRRVPIDTSGVPPETAARLRLGILRDLIRMEMPDRWQDVTGNPISVTAALPRSVITVTRQLQRPALSLRFLQRHTSQPPAGSFSPAECLYMFVATDPEARAQFQESEIGDADEDTWPEFIDAWGRPIMFIRWAPGFSSGPPFNGDSQIQSGDAQNDHDPFDSRKVDAGAFRLVPLIYSGGPDKKYDLYVGTHSYLGDPYAFNTGAPTDDPSELDGELNHFDNIHNHHIEQR